MTKDDIIAAIATIIVLVLLWNLPPYTDPAIPKPSPAIKAACPDFPPVDGAGRPAVCEK